MCVFVCMCVIGNLGHFQQSFSHIATVAACCIRRESARILSAANTDAPYRRHNTSPRLSRHRANQSWFHPLNAERLARKQPVPIVTPLVMRGQGSNRDFPTMRRALYLLCHPAGTCNGSTYPFVISAVLKTLGDTVSPE